MAASPVALLTVTHAIVVIHFLSSSHKSLDWSHGLGRYLVHVNELYAALMWYTGLSPRGWHSQDSMIHVIQHTRCIWGHQYISMFPSTTNNGWNDSPAAGISRLPVLRNW